MNVAELIEFLKKFPQDAPIAFTWETVVEPIYPDDIYVVMIGTDYKDEFLSGAMSAREEGGIKKHIPDTLVHCQECGALLETDVHCDNCGSFHPTRR
jgi:hypothetical protein